MNKYFLIGFLGFLTVFSMSSKGPKKKATSAVDQEFEQLLLEQKALNKVESLKALGCTAEMSQAVVAERITSCIELLAKQELLCETTKDLFQVWAKLAVVNRKMKSKYNLQEVGDKLRYPHYYSLEEIPSLLYPLFLIAGQFKDGAFIVSTSLMQESDLPGIKMLASDERPDIRIFAEYLYEEFHRNPLNVDSERLSNLVSPLLKELDREFTRCDNSLLKSKLTTLKELLELMLGYGAKAARARTCESDLDIEMSLITEKIYHKYREGENYQFLLLLKEILKEVESGAMKLEPVRAKVSHKPKKSVKKVVKRLEYSEAASAPPIDEAISLPLELPQINHEFIFQKKELTLVDQLAQVIHNSHSWLPRVSLWLGTDEQQTKAVQLREDEEGCRFSLTAQKNLIRHHAFNCAVDTYVQSLGIVIPWKEEGSYSINIPGELCYSDGTSEIGVFSWGINLKKNICFHRSFSKKSYTDIQDLVQERIFDVQFPPLNYASAFHEVEIPVALRGQAVDKGLYIEINDDRNSMVIRLYKVKR